MVMRRRVSEDSLVTSHCPSASRYEESQTRTGHQERRDELSEPQHILYQQENSSLSFCVLGVDSVRSSHAKIATNEIEKRKELVTIIPFYKRVRLNIIISGLLTNCEFNFLINIFLFHSLSDKNRRRVKMP